MATQKIPLVTPQEYISQEKQAAFKSEFIAGHLFAMAGASLEHNNVKADLLVALATTLRQHSLPCDVHDSDQRINVADFGPYFYPDVSVVCGESRVDESDSLLNPKAIFEVLSPSTNDFDRGEKFFHYRRLESLEEYVLVHLTAPLLEHYVRQSDNLWTLREVRGLEAVLELGSLGITVPLREIYRRLRFDI
jgi:Uma2 family endonuclease